MPLSPAVVAKDQSGSGLHPELEIFWPQEVLGAVPYAQDDHGLPADLEKDAVDLPALAVEELAQALVPLGFGRLGAAFGIVFKRVDRFEERVPPAVGRGLGALGDPVILLFDRAGGFAGDGDMPAQAFLAFCLGPSAWRNSRAGTVRPASASALASPRNSIISALSARAKRRW